MITLPPDSRPPHRRPDGFHAEWLAAHEGLSEARSAILDARRVLLLAKQCGDPAVLLACIQAARAQRDRARWPAYDSTRYQPSPK